MRIFGDYRTRKHSRCRVTREIWKKKKNIRNELYLIRYAQCAHQRSNRIRGWQYLIYYCHVIRWVSWHTRERNPPESLVTHELLMCMSPTPSLPSDGRGEKKCALKINEPRPHRSTHRVLAVSLIWIGFPWPFSSSHSRQLQFNTVEGQPLIDAFVEFFRDQ